MRATGERDPVAWRLCLPYERTEAVNELRAVLSRTLFAPDDLRLRVRDAVRCVAGAPADRTDGLMLEGFVSASRIAAIDAIEQRLVKGITDFRARTDFGACVCDELPAIPVTPLHPVPAPTSAKRLWQRARWAVRAGVVKRIGDARAGVVTSAAPSPRRVDRQSTSVAGATSSSVESSPSETAPRTRRSFVPMTTYHAAVTSPDINLSRFAANNPCVIVAWASWDDASVAFLEQHIFNVEQGDRQPPPPPKESPRGPASVPAAGRGGQSAAPRDVATAATTAAPDDDPWLRFASRYIDFRTFHAHVAAALPPVNVHVSHTARHTSAGIAQQAAIDNALAASAMRASIPAFYRNFAAFDAADADGNAQDGDGDDMGGGGLRHHHNTNRGLRDRQRKERKRHSRWVVSKLSDAKAVASHAHAVSAVGVTRAQGRRGLRLGHIVLVSFDYSPGEAQAALRKLQDRIGSYVSSTIALHSVWAGEDGMHGELGTYLNAKSLPFVLCAQPERQWVGDEPVWYDIPVVTLVQDLDAAPLQHGRRNAAATATGSASGVSASGGREPGAASKAAWHDLPHDAREALTAPIVALLEQWDAPLVFESAAVYEYNIFGEKVVDSTLDSATERSSSVSLTGTATEAMRDALRPHLARLISQVRSVHVDIKVIEASGTIKLPLNPRTAEHRVHGWQADVTCTHCGVRVHLDRSDHFHCLHCDGARASVCSACVGSHDEAHVLLQLLAGTPAAVHVLWGPTNVARLPTVRGRLVKNVSGSHAGVYCNVCAGPVKGVRWKCACCSDFDLCTTCFDYWVSSAKQKRTNERRHPTDHHFLRIAVAVPGDSSAMIVPRTSTLTTASFITATNGAARAL